VGLNFLPRGEGVCTRRPLEMRLVHTFDGSDPWAKFEGSEQKYNNFDEVRR
jgi:dynamin 1-like protein